MTRKFLTILLLFSFLLPGLLLAQSQILRTDGSLQDLTKDDREAIEMTKMQILQRDNIDQAKLKSFNQLLATADTLRYDDMGSFTTNFGQFGQDVMLQWFVAPADMDVIAMRVGVTDNEYDNITVKLVKVNWTLEQFQSIATTTARFGYYTAAGRPLDSNPFLGDETTTGGWNWDIELESGASAADSTDWIAWGPPFGDDLWSEFGAGASVTLPTAGWTDWLAMSLIEVPSVLQGEVFGVALINSSDQLDIDPDPPARTGFEADAARGIGAWKYYAKGRNTVDGDWGWWHRDYTWNVQVAVSLTGDRAPVIQSYTQLATTLSTEARMVDAVIVDDNPGGGAAGVAEAILSYSTDDGANWNEIVMSGSEPNFSASIPGQVPGTFITYNITAKDVGDNSVSATPVSYAIFEAIEQVLFVYDHTFFSPGVLGPYYWNQVNDTIFAYDTWEESFGPVSNELLENYQIVYHVMGSGPANQGYDIGGVYKTYLDGATAQIPRNVFISGHDYGFISGYNDTTFEAGSFEYDYLGINLLGRQDVADSPNDAYAVDAVASSPLSGHLAAYEGDSLQLFYYPALTFDTPGNGGYSNWIDNLLPVEGAVVDFTNPACEDSAVAIHNSGDNWKTVFWTMDVLQLDFYSPEDTTSMYHWVFDAGNPLVPILDWFGAPVTAIGDGEVALARSYKLSQNYPNPFNPTTTIEYSIPNQAKVTLKVFDIQGKEVATLVDNYEKSGTHTVNFDASQYATGIYFYQLTTNNHHTLVKKMMFIK